MLRIRRNRLKCFRMRFLEYNTSLIQRQQATDNLKRSQILDNKAFLQELDNFKEFFINLGLLVIKASVQ